MWIETMHALLSKKKIGVLKGGFGVERAVSLRSGLFVEKVLREAGYNVFGIDVTDRFLDDRVLLKECDIFYNTLHGTFGEDGRIQGLLDFLDKPYTGEGVLASALSFNKLRTKQVLLNEKNINRTLMAKHVDLGILSREKPSEDFDAKKCLEKIETEGLTLPFFLKKMESGSSIGVFWIDSCEVWEEIFWKENLAKRSGLFYAEEWIEGREITIGAYRKMSGEIEVLPLLEVVSKNVFYDFKAKYTQGLTQLKQATFLLEEGRNALCLSVRNIYDFMDFRGCVRMDFVIKNDDAYLLEINTQPGMTELSDIPAMLKYAKKPVLTFLEEILLVCLKTFDDEAVFLNKKI